MIRSAREMPEARRRLVRWLSGCDVAPPEQAYAIANAEASTPRHIRELPEAERAAGYAAWVKHVARAADLFWVAADLTELAQHAGQSVPEYRLHPEVVPADAGLLCWGGPIGGVGVGDIVGVLWRSLPEGVWVELLVDVRDEAVRLGARGVAPEILGAVGWLTPDVEFLLPWGTPWVMDPAVARARAITTLHATWLLMGQTLTVSRPERPQRSERRRLVRQGMGDPTVTYVALRRHAPPGDLPSERDESAASITTVGW